MGIALALFGTGAIVDAAMFAIGAHRLAARLGSADRRFAATGVVALTAGLAAFGFKAAFTTFITTRPVVTARRACVANLRLAIVTAIGASFAARLRGTLGARLTGFLFTEIAAAEFGIL
ncbi:MAG: hypothetical protein J0626_05040, partial [Rhodospirillaceae bacterium]|nr:hypothetical protein [Rhodospirillaceae bacterium]